ncbi:ABC transporter permease [Oceanibacterium hippocampi]|uniref:Putative aliphatic sulfonates transport permease protein SsuC n=1 Tax=Oceanibacterium hippocampi TaxID=745714 RepID=A0A1Y5TPT6_9PROT|nr:ABC transporter permease [Oceanibacterium hippocampi]SLN65459.1 Putative aliphatic sulfonates transport permease protein SsuC [Oceanibacterium hippocampi]
MSSATNEADMTRPERDEIAGPKGSGKDATGLFARLMRQQVYLYLVLPLSVLLLWHVTAAHTDLFPPVLLPTPWKVVVSGMAMIESGELLSHIRISLGRILTGMAFSVCLALPLGVFMGLSRRFEKIADGLISLIRPIPPLAWLPLAVLWLGIGNATVVFITSVAGFFVILVNTIAGVKGVDQVLMRAAMSLGAKGSALIFRVVLPAAIPAVITAVRVAVGISWMSIVAAEFVAASDGLGYLITFYQDVLRTDIVIVGMFTIGALGISMDVLLRRLEHFLVPWHEGVKVGR